MLLQMSPQDKPNQLDIFPKMWQGLVMLKTNSALQLEAHLHAARVQKFKENCTVEQSACHIADGAHNCHPQYQSKSQHGCRPDTHVRG